MATYGRGFILPSYNATEDSYEGIWNFDFRYQSPFKFLKTVNSSLKLKKIRKFTFRWQWKHRRWSLLFYNWTYPCWTFYSGIQVYDKSSYGFSKTLSWNKNLCWWVMNIEGVGSSSLKPYWKVWKNSFQNKIFFYF